MSLFYHPRAAEGIVPTLSDLVQTRSLPDGGCGISTFLAVFKRLGVKEVLGIDGPWVRRELLAKYPVPHEFMERDLTAPFGLPRNFDLIVSLEVAEHLPEEAAERFGDSLTASGDTIAFSAAIPGQGRQNHLNEQPLSHWIDKFQARGFQFCDCLRPLFWTDQDIYWWYRQNMVLFIREGAHSHLPASSEVMADLVHPESNQAHAQTGPDHHQEYLRGKAPWGSYLKPLLKRALGPRLTKSIKGAWSR